jgi:hypothetical protein
MCQYGKLNCSISTGGAFTCAWCGLTGELTAYTGDGIASGGDI